MTQKLSPELMVHLRALARREAGRVPAAEVQRIELLLEFTGDIADLVAVGFSPRSVLKNPDEGYTIATGTLPVDRLADLAAIDHVVEVEGSQKLIPHLNYSVPTMHADAVHAGTPPRTGRNVVIGIIDSGIDWRHGDFVDPNTGKSRILALWNQRLDPPDPGRLPVRVESASYTTTTRFREPSRAKGKCAAAWERTVPMSPVSRPATVPPLAAAIARTPTSGWRRTRT